MMKDYAYTPRKKHPPKRHRLFIFLALVILIALCFIFVGKTNHGGVKQKTTPIHNTTTINTKKNTAKKTAKKHNANQPHFDFYTLLPKMQVPVPNGNKLTQNQTNTSNVYLLQIASLQHARDAQRLQKKLSQLGVVSTVQKFKTDNVIWHRVVAGPFQNLQQTQKTQNILQKKGFDSIRVQAK